MMEDTIVIKPFPTEQPRDLSATSRYMADRDHGGAKVPLDESGQPMSGAINCVSDGRGDQLHEMETLLRLHGNPRSTQAAQHCVLSYPKGVRPTREQIERDLKINLKKQGMSDHLLVWDAHDNTDNFHVHFLLCRVVPYSESDKYPLANNGLVKVTRKDKRGKVRTRTDEAACRQAAIAEINELYGYGTDGLTHDKYGKPQYQNKQKDTHSDKTRAGERKTGKKSKERQLSEAVHKILENSSSWYQINCLLAEKAIEITFKTQGSKIIGGYVTGPDHRKCSLAKCGSSYFALEKRLGEPSSRDEAIYRTDYELEPFEYKNSLTHEEAKKRLTPVFKNITDWPHLITDIQHHGMHLERSGGGLVVKFNDGQDAIKCSEISNKYSLSKLESVLGPCPLPKAAPPSITPRDLLIQDAAAILKKHVEQGHGLSWLKPDLTHANIRIEQKVFQNNDGQQQKYFALVRGEVSVPISSIAKRADGKPAYTMWMLEQLDTRDHVAKKSKVVAEQKRRSEIENQRWAMGGDLYENYQQEAVHAKESKVNSLSFFAAIAQFIKHKNLEKDDVHTNSSSFIEERSGIRSPSFS